MYIIKYFIFKSNNKIFFKDINKFNEKTKFQKQLSHFKY